LPVKVVVFKNEAVAFVEPEMKAAGILDPATEFRNPDLATIAKAAGLLGLTAEKPYCFRHINTKK
jgi:pyruvate dehydrogenase (quinone)